MTAINDLFGNAGTLDQLVKNMAPKKDYDWGTFRVWEQAGQYWVSDVTVANKSARRVPVIWDMLDGWIEDTNEVERLAAERAEAMSVNDAIEAKK